MKNVCYGLRISGQHLHHEPFLMRRSLVLLESGGQLVHQTTTTDPPKSYGVAIEQ